MQRLSRLAIWLMAFSLCAALPAFAALPGTLPPATSALKNSERLLSFSREKPRLRLRSNSFGSATAPSLARNVSEEQIHV